MTLLNELYTIAASHTDLLKAEYTLQLRSDSIIYKAHFPKHPITPGVCIIRMAVELAESYLESQLTLFTVKSVKFLSVISPEETKEVVYILSCFKKEGNILSFKCNVTVNEAVLAKMSLICKIQ